MEENIMILVNYNNSLTWILRPFGDDFPYIHHDSRDRSQWGRDQIYPEWYSHDSMIPPNLMVNHQLPGQHRLGGWKKNKTHFQNAKNGICQAFSPHLCVQSSVAIGVQETCDAIDEVVPDTWLSWFPTIFRGFHNWWYPNSWMVHNWKSDEQGWFRVLYSILGHLHVLTIGWMVDIQILSKGFETQLYKFAANDFGLVLPTTDLFWPWHQGWKPHHTTEGAIWTTSCFFF